MTDTPLLRLARALLDGAECRATFDETTDRVRSLVRDLEAAPFPDTGLEPRGCPTPGACSCPVARRTITREEWEWMRDWIGQAFANDVRERLRLTVEG